MAPAEATAEACAPIETKSLRKEPSMHPQSTSTPDPATAQPAVAAQPQLPLAGQMVTAMAENFGVCTRPLAIRRIDRFTGLADFIEVPCCARSASKCKPCAVRQRRLRQQQIMEGWHLTSEPVRPVKVTPPEVEKMVLERAELTYQRIVCERTISDAEARTERLREIDKQIDLVDLWLGTHKVRGKLAHPADKKQRKVRSTRRRTDAAELPRLCVEGRTTGPVYHGHGGRTYQPSMLVTVTLPSYGPVHTGARTRRGLLEPCSCGHLHGEQDPVLGTPLDMDGYDYGAAARDVMFFTAVLDRFWQ